ncbi:GerMN domain-containing protein [Bacillus kwashiorkori]|uniref:GerMN domain-containing protein n=1 Tax=Bacillus kwashiorkori TaxID=1522318 RepID=UPI000784C922|nr:GerMN domain-containing protein [Bacillus kwashiorkori]
MKKKFFFLFILTASILLSGCGLFGGSKEKIDPPKSSVTYEDDLNVSKDEKDEESVDEKIKTELYLIDKHGFVVPQTFELPKTTSVAKQALEHLVADGPISEMLPNDFRAVLPAGTELTVDITDDGVATVNFSKEFKDYAAEDELKILESITWTLTQFDTVTSVKLKLNGNELKEMPVNGTPISEVLSRKTGINYDVNGVVDLANTHPVTVYYVAQTDYNSYYVPVTKRISNEKTDKVSSVVEQLIKGPNINSPLFSLFNPDAELLEAKVEDGIATLNFNENVLANFDKNVISNDLLNMIVLSLTELEDIKGVSIQVNGDSSVVTQEGEPMTEPVTRPKNVNTGSF